MCKVAIISDFYDGEYLGGAELTTKALLDRAPYEVKKLRSLEINDKVLDEHKDYFLIFGNFAHMKYTLLPRIAAEFDYVILEYDYKFCMHRSMDVHKKNEGVECDCQKYYGQNMADFFLRAKTIFWMSVEQLKVYLKRFPRLIETYSVVLSSVFSREDLQFMARLRNEHNERHGWAYQNSGTWQKGIEAAQDHIAKHSLEGKALLKMSHEKFLKELARAEGFIFLPAGIDSCPRVVIEAKLCGCKLIINDKVQHGGEQWFNKSVPEVEAYLDQRPDRFWKKINSLNQVKEEKVTHG